MPRRQGAQWSQRGLGPVSPSSAEALSDLRTKGNPYSRPCPLEPHLPSCLHQRPGRGQPATPLSPPSGSQSSPNTVIMNRTATSSAHSPGSSGLFTNTFCLTCSLILAVARRGGPPHWGGMESGDIKRRQVHVPLVIQWLRIHLPMQETRVRSLLQEDRTCHRATKARAPQLLSPRVKSPCSAAREAAAMRSPCAGTGG